MTVLVHKIVTVHAADASPEETVYTPMWCAPEEVVVTDTNGRIFGSLDHEALPELLALSLRPPPDNL